MLKWILEIKCLEIDAKKLFSLTQDEKVDIITIIFESITDE